MVEAPRSVLVTGGTGVVGSAVVAEFCRRGMEVFVVTRRPDRAPAGTIPIIADIADPRWTAECRVAKHVDAIVYMAYATTRNERHDARVTYEGLTEIVDAVPARRIVFLGSTAVFGRNPESGVYSESSSRRADSHYAQMKIRAVDFLKARADHASTVLHLSHVYSATGGSTVDHANLLSFTYFVDRDAGKSAYNLVHVDDVVPAVLAALDRDHGGAFEEYIINGETLQFGEWLQIIERKFGYDKRAKLPHFLAPITRGPARRFLSGFGRRPAYLPRDKFGLTNRNVVFSSAKAFRDLNWRPLRTARSLLAGNDDI